MRTQQLSQTDGFVYMTPLFTLYDGGCYRLWLFLRTFTIIGHWLSRDSELLKLWMIAGSKISSRTEKSHL